MNNKIPVILDTDICDDIDDLYALMACIMHPKIELKAVTLVYSEVLKKAKFVSKIFRLMGVQNVPIGIGTKISKHRLLINQTDPPYENLICYDKFVKETDPETNYKYPSANEVLKKILDENKKTNIICIGALSNIGELISTYPNPQDKINLISIMGGEIEKQHPEHNIHCDPEAAQIVLNSGISIFMGTFFQTRQITFPKEDLKKYFPNPEKNIVHKIFRECHNMWWGNDPYIYDLGPVYYLLHPELYETEDISVQVELEGQSRGYTVPVYNSNKKNIKYSKKINNKAIIKLATDLYNNRYSE